MGSFQITHGSTACPLAAGVVAWDSHIGIAVGAVVLVAEGVVGRVGGRGHGA